MGTARCFCCVPVFGHVGVFADKGLREIFNSNAGFCVI